MHSQSSTENMSSKPSVENREHMDPIDRRDTADIYPATQMNGTAATGAAVGVNGAPLDRRRTYGSISISPEMFEELYLQPKNKVKGDLRIKFGNPTPVAIGGFILTTTPLSMALLGWQGAGGLVAPANV